MLKNEKVILTLRLAFCACCIFFFKSQNCPNLNDAARVEFTAGKILLQVLVSVALTVKEERIFLDPHLAPAFSTQAVAQRPISPEIAAPEQRRPFFFEVPTYCWGLKILHFGSALSHDCAISLLVEYYSTLKYILVFQHFNPLSFVIAKNGKRSEKKG